MSRGQVPSATHIAELIRVSHDVLSPARLLDSECGCKTCEAGQDGLSDAAGRCGQSEHGPRENQACECPWLGRHGHHCHRGTHALPVHKDRDAHIRSCGEEVLGTRGDSMQARRRCGQRWHQSRRPRIRAAVAGLVEPRARKAGSHELGCKSIIQAVHVVSVPMRKDEDLGGRSAVRQERESPEGGVNAFAGA